MRQKLGVTTRFTIFEKNTDVGGTWFNNVYPGKVRFFEYSSNFSSNVVDIDIVILIINLVICFWNYIHLPLSPGYKIDSFEKDF